MSNTDSIKTKNRLTYIDPNTFASYFNASGNKHLRMEGINWNPEDLAMSVDLQVIIPRRSDKGRENYLIQANNVVMRNTGKTPIGRYVSYMGGMPLNQKENSESYLTDNYTNISFQEVVGGKIIDKESLGLDSIDINFDAHFFPIVTIKFTDVRGSSLFMPSEQEFDASLRGESAPNSFFKALFHFPYPRFLLSVKGFYGNRVTFQLAVSDFTSAFQSDTGNYDVTVKFIGYVYGLYTDLPLNLVMASPYYNNTYWQEQKSNGTFRYMSKDGGVGGEMKNYVEFLTKLDGRDVTSEHLNNTEFISQYHSNDSKKSLLESIKKCHDDMFTRNHIGPKHDTVEIFIGSEKVCVYGQLDNTTYNSEFKFGIKTDDESESTARKYLLLINKLNSVSSSSEFNSFMDGNVFFENFKKSGRVFPIINIDDSDVDAFQTVNGSNINNFFSIDNTGKIIDIKEATLFNENLRNQIIGKKVNNQYSCVVLDRTKYLSNLEKIIEKIKSDNENSISEVSTELVSVFENVIGFAPTVENFYRMLFAHIDCFFNYFNVKILGDITKQTNEKQRRVEYFTDAGNFDISEIDIPKTLTGGSDAIAEELDVYPFPGYYVKKEDGGITRLTAEYPGKSPNSRFRKIREVDGVEKMLDGVMKLKEAINQIDSNFNSNEDGDFEDDTFSILSPLYNCENPWKSMDFTFVSTESDIYTMLYFYMCLLMADKAVGTNLNGDGDNAYHKRVAKLLASKLLSASESFKNTLNDIKIGIDSGNISLNDILSNEHFKKHKLNVFDVSDGKIVINKSSNGNLLPLKIDGKKFNRNVTEAIEDSWVINLNKNEVENRYCGITGYGMLENFKKSPGFGEDDTGRCKEYRSKVKDFENFTSYLSDLDNDNLNKTFKGNIPYGFSSVSFPKNKNTQPILIGNDIKNKITSSAECVTYNVKWDNIKREYPFWEEDYSKIIKLKKQEYENGFDPELGAITKGLKNFYTNGVYPEIYGTTFVGSKILDVETYIRNSKLTLSGERYPAINLFSGLIDYTVYRNNGRESIHIIKHGKYTNEFKSLQDQDEIKKVFYKPTNTGVYKYDPKYLPLIEQPKCTYKLGDQLQLKQYAFATYFCAALSGINRLTSIAQYILNPKIVVPVRLVDVLYLGGVLFFMKWKNDNRHNGEAPVYKTVELIKYGKNINEAQDEHNFFTLSGMIGDGLLYDVVDANGHRKTDSIGGLTKNQNLVDLEKIMLNEHVMTTLINKFTDWCDNELFNGVDSKFNMLSSYANKSTEYDDKIAVCADLGFVYKEPDGTLARYPRFVLTRGYTVGGECEKWLTKLTYSYTHLASVTYNGIDLTITKDEIVKFLDSLINLIGTGEANEESQSPANEVALTDSQSADARLALYYTLKNLYDKWLCTYNAQEFKLKTPQQDINMRKNRYCGVSLDKDKNGEVNRNNLVEKCSEYNNFVYVDQFYNDISFDYIMDADYIGEIIRDIYRGDTNCDVYTFMSMMAEKNNLMLIALPVFNNMYNASSIASVFSPNTLYNANNYDGYNGIGTTYVVMYTSDVSHQPSLYDKYDYNRDYLDIADVVGNTGSEDLLFFSSPASGSNRLNYDVSAFAVTYGAQNQMYFKKVNVSMDSPKVTDESIRNVLMLSEAGSQGPTEQPSAIGQNIYSIYSNRSYTCTVEMLGCANITPMMYFQLNNIPMFRGLYMIINVKHNIKAGDMTTIFTGIRVSRYSLPKINDILMHSCIFRRIMSADSSSNNSSGGGSSLPYDSAVNPAYANYKEICKDGKKAIDPNIISQLKINYNKRLADEAYRNRISEFISATNSLNEKWTKAAIIGLAAGIAAEGGFANDKIINLGEFRGVNENSSANSSSNRPWPYGAGIIQWSNKRKIDLVIGMIPTCTNENEAKIYLNNGVPAYKDRENYHRDKKTGEVTPTWSGGIENWTVEQQVKAIDWEFRNRPSFNIVRRELSKITGTTIEDIIKATLIVFAWYIGGVATHNGTDLDNDACNTHRRYEKKNGEEGVNRRLAWAELLYDKYINSL